MNKVELSEIQRRMLSLLKGSVLYKPGFLGATLWGKQYRMPQAYTRPAGKVLKALVNKGYVAWRSDHDQADWVTL